MNIREFKNGDVITRVERTKNIGDGSYIGDEMILMNIENGCIYFYRYDRFLSNHNHNVPLCDWEDGWEYYKNPITTYDNILEHIDIKIIEAFLRKKKLEKVSKK